MITQKRCRLFRTASSSHILGKPMLGEMGSDCFSLCLALWSCLCLLDARLPWQQTGAVIWRSCPFHPGCLNSSLRLVVGRERGQTKSPNNLLSAPDCPACNSDPSCPWGMLEYRGSSLRACHRFKLLRLTRLNVENPTDNKWTETFGLCSLLCRVCCFTSRGKIELTHSCTEHLGLEEHSLTASEPLPATPPSPDPLFDMSGSARGSPHPLLRLLLSAVCAPEL